MPSCHTLVGFHLAWAGGDLYLQGAMGLEWGLRGSQRDHATIGAENGAASGYELIILFTQSPKPPPAQGKGPMPHQGLSTQSEPSLGSNL